MTHNDAVNRTPENRRRRYAVVLLASAGYRKR